LFRNTANQPNFKQVQFSDKEYVHSYEKNIAQVTEDVWTGTSYQVRLNYRKDFLTTGAVEMLVDDKEDQNDNSSITTRGIQFHFHHPSEHTIDGKEYALELHIVHKLMYVQKNQEQLFNKFRYLVTAVFFDVPTNMNTLNES